MNWVDDTQKAVNYIESNLLKDISVSDVASHIHSSADYFARVFNIVTGISVSDYIRNRRLTLAGDEIVNTQVKVIDVALKYGYDSPDSFTKAFTRFHGVTPTVAKSSDTQLEHFCPLSIKIFIKGGFGMSRKVIPNIPVIDNYGNEVNYIVNLLEATFAVAGETTDKAELAAYSGMANRFVWTDGKWGNWNEAMGSINETPFEAEVRLLKAIGWAAKFITVHRDKDGNPLNTDNEQIKQDFVAAINKGYPVFYLNQKSQMYNIVIGYEDNGQKIICKNHVPTIAVHTDSETVLLEDWEDTINEYILLKEKVELAPERERALNLFKLIVSLARKTDEINGRKVGFAAWESYLHMLEHDDFSDLPLEEVGMGNGTGRMCAYCDGLCQIYGRKDALPYYRSLAERYPEWREELEAAVAALDACADYGGFLWSQGFTIDDAGYEKFRDPAARKILADEGRRAMQKDMEAVEQFEKILKKENIQ